jgi:cell division protein FtsB
MFQHLYKNRRDEVRTTTTTEIVFILLLIISLFAYYANQKANIKEREIEILNIKIEELIKDNKKLEQIINKQNTEIKDLKEEIKDLKKLVTAMPPDNPNFTIKNLGDEIAELKKQLDALKKKIAALKGQGKGGSDWPRCLPNETPPFIFKVVLSRNGYTVSKSGEWLDDLPRYNSIFYGVPGVKGILSTGLISLKKFKLHARKIYYWGTTQATKCRFRVRLVLGISKDPSFPSGILTELRQAVEDYFYIKILKNG